MDAGAGKGNAESGFDPNAPGQEAGTSSDEGDGATEAGTPTSDGPEDAGDRASSSDARLDAARAEATDASVAIEDSSARPDGTMTRDAAPVPMVVTSNLPDVEFRRTIDGYGSADLLLRTSTLRTTPAEDEVLVEWYAVVHNAGSEPRCSAQALIDFESPAGDLVASFWSEAAASPHDAGQRWPVPCIPPGEEGVFFVVEPWVSAPEVAQIGFAHVKLYAVDYADPLPHPDAPSPTSLDVYSPAPETFVVRGALHAGATIHDVGVTVFPVDSSGLIVGMLDAVLFETLVAGAEWNYETSPYGGPAFEDFYQFVDFRPGASPDPR